MNGFDQSAPSAPHSLSLWVLQDAVNSSTCKAAGKRLAKTLSKVQGISQRKALSHVRAETAIWEIASAVRVVFDTYGKLIKTIDIRFDEQDDKNCGDFVESWLRVNGNNFDAEDMIDMDPVLLDKMTTIDDMQALFFLRELMVNALGDEQVDYAERLQNVLGAGTITSSREAYDLSMQADPEVAEERAADLTAQEISQATVPPGPQRAGKRL